MAASTSKTTRALMLEMLMVDGQVNADSQGLSLTQGERNALARFRELASMPGFCTAAEAFLTELENLEAIQIRQQAL